MNLSHNTSTNEAQSALGSAAGDGTRLTELREALSIIYGAVPKNEHGLISHQVVRYVLHRFFQQRHGWFIKGLAPNETQAWHHDSSAKNETPTIKEWVPSFLQDQLEQGSMNHTGTDLNGLALIAAALEQIVRDETHDRMKMAYAMHDWPVGPLTDEQASAVTHTFFVSFLLAGRFEWSSISQVKSKEMRFAQVYPSYKETMDWMLELEELETAHYKEMGNAYGKPEYVERFANAIGEQYYEYAEADCIAMKHALMELESKKAGRVRLSNFYGKSKFSGFKFNEKADYLEALGALDVSDPKNPQVIIPNYVMARSNCLEASSIYAVCCRNQCEDLIINIESQIQSALAKPRQIVDLVSKLATDTVQAPRVLSTELVSRLEQVAAQHHGHVPIHGRLFSQWLHHAFPRECPYPYQLGVTAPLTPYEWLQSSGKSDTEANAEEMRQTVESDECQVDDLGNFKGGCKEDASIPWSDEEELLSSYVLTHHNADAAKDARSVTQWIQRFATACAVSLAQIAFIVLCLDYLRARTCSQSSTKEVLYINQVNSHDLEIKLSGLRKSFGLWLAVCIAWTLDLPDASVLICAVCCYMVILATRSLYQIRAATKSCKSGPSA